MKQAGSDLVIHGIGSSSGGVFRDVSIHGTGRVSGDITCERWDAHGTCRVMGDVQAKRLAVHGTFHCHGDVAAGEMAMHGSASVDGQINIQLLSVHGRIAVAGPVKAERVEMEGVLRADADFQAEQMRLRGVLSVDGLLNVGRLEIDLYGPSQVREIGGGHVSIRSARRRGWFRWIHPFRRHKLTAWVIEGDEVYLEDTQAQVVRGANVRIGRGCEIGLVEYTGSLEKAPEARVTEERRVGGPDASE
ncbi:polymer-forming cytoskeletal protein [Alicyclobacillus shizuokensis]|uniref:polymer-forming cytoskeletal protein n=1 Tax=Alicyclobacillus shizuokensis TaxID=392014 RepID=UPI0008333844|nr:polymer-forming cytoskeletal protein [Alicyclobacillus shizuokensis]MCL6626818.1 polymer-forming cytoskeletal protein [Alicyclobacillus shizuokensis]